MVLRSGHRHRSRQRRGTLLLLLLLLLQRRTRSALHKRLGRLSGAHGRLHRRRGLLKLSLLTHM